MSIDIIAVGKLKEKYLKEASTVFEAKIRAFTKLNIIEIPDEDTNIGQNSSLAKIIKEKEASKILRALKKDDYIIALDLEGKQLKTSEFINHTKTILNQNKKIVFIIGGSLGLASSVLDLANFRLCFSNMTFPHQLARIILLEQLVHGDGSLAPKGITIS